MNVYRAKYESIKILIRIALPRLEEDMQFSCKYLPQFHRVTLIIRSHAKHQLQDYEDC